MNHSFLFTSISVVVVTVSFLVYYFTGQSTSISKKFEKNWGKEKSQLRLILFRRLLGIFCFGLIPFAIIIFTSDNLGILPALSFKNITETFILLIVITPFLILITFRTAHNPKNLELYPQIRAATWNLSLIILSTLSWLAYLFAYEFLFRGFFFFSCLAEMGVIPAIAVNISLYSLVHLPKGVKETVGAIPLGILLCIATYRTETIWVAFGIHSVLALSNEWFSIKHNPGMKISF